MALVVDEVVPEQPETEPVLLVEGLLLSGQPFTFAVRASQGDTFEETGEHLRWTSGTTGENVRIFGPAIASVSQVTRQCPKIKPVKPIKVS